MNKRIEELIAKATTVEDTYPAGCDGHPVPVYSFDKEKFAELIVKECADVITALPNKMVDMPLSPYNEGWRNGRLLAKEHIESHFGVKE